MERSALVTLRNWCLGVAAAAVLGMVPADAQAALDLRIDFGGSAASPGTNWNTVTTEVTNSAVTDFVTGDTSHGVTFSFDSSATLTATNNHWDVSNDGPDWLDPSKSAAVDAIRSGWNTVYTITFSDLDPGETYTLEFVSSSSSENKVIPWRVNGGTATNWNFKADGYENGDWMTWVEIQPDANNQIVLKNDKRQVNPHINAVRLTSTAVPEPGSILLAGSGGLLLMLRRRRA